VYKFSVPWGTTQFTVRARTQQISLLEPRLTVYDASGNVVSSTVSTSPLTGSIVIQVPNAVPGATYYAKVQSGSQDVFGIGGYRIKVFFGSYDPTLPPITLPVLTDGHTNDAPGAATTLIRLPMFNSMRFDYTVRASLEDATDVDVYRVQAPPATNPV